MDSARTESSSVVSSYLATIQARPLLTREQEVELAERVRDGCEEARNRLVEANLGFVMKVARDYRNLGLPLEDLLSEGSLGLMTAAERFDPTRGTKFITFATWWIRKTILEALGRSSGLVRVPQYQKRRVREVRETQSSLRRRLGREPDRFEVSEMLSENIAAIDRTLQLGLPELSLDQSAGARENVLLGDLLADSEERCPERQAIDSDARRRVGRALEALTERERTVIVHRYGLGEGPALALKDVGEKLGVSRERVRQIESRAKIRLRRLLGGNGRAASSLVGDRERPSGSRPRSSLLRAR